MLRAFATSRRMAREIGARVARLLVHPVTASAVQRALGHAPTRFAIAESFSIWFIDEAAILDSPDKVDLRDVARPTARIHHQIAADGERVAYARSATSESVADPLQALTVSTLAHSVDRAVAWLDAHVRQRAEVRFLSVPTAGTKALWVVPAGRRPTRVFVLVAPTRSGIARGRLVTAREFLRQLRRAQRRRAIEVRGTLLEE